MSHFAFFKWIYSVLGSLIAVAGVLRFCSVAVGLAMISLCCIFLRHWSQFSGIDIASLFFILVIIRYILGKFSIYIDIIFRKKLFRYLLQSLSDGVCCFPEKAITWQQFVTLDVVTLQERLSLLADGLCYAMCLCLSLGLVIYLNIDIGYLAVMLAPYIYGAVYISKKTSSITKEIYSVSQKRVKRISLWLSSRKYFVNWNNDFGLLKSIEKLLQKEISLRNKDSFLKCLDFYSVVFSRAVPVAYFMLFDWLKGDGCPQYDYVAIYWFSMPVINIIMEIGRFSSDYVLAKESATNLFFALSSGGNCSKPFSKKIILDNTWDIWSGTLYDNIVFCEQLSKYIKLFRIDTELSSADSFNINLERGGGNISLGQKERIILLRAISLALQTGLPLYIKKEFNSVDSEICSAILQSFNELKHIISIEVSPGSKQHLIRMVSGKDKIYTHDDAVSQRKVLLNNSYLENKSSSEANDVSLLRWFFKINNKISILFMLPALSLSFVSHFCSENSLSRGSKTFAILFLSVLAWLLACKLGAHLEAAVRKTGKKLVLELLAKVSLTDKSDVMQRVGRDLTVIFERVSWYTHDIFWYGSVLFAGFIYVSLYFLFYGLATNFIFIIIFTLIGFYFSPKIKIAQKSFIFGVNNFLLSVLDYNSMGSAWHNSLLRAKYFPNLSNRLNRFQDASVQLASLKSNFSNTIQVVSGFFITIAIFLFSYKYKWFSPEILLTSILMIDHTIVKFFQATSGFNVCHISCHRLVNYSHAQPYSPPLVLEDSDTVTVPESADVSRTRYRSYQFKKCTIYKIAGLSGSGKSMYLKAISGTADDPIWDSFAKIPRQVPVYMDDTSIRLLRKMGINYQDLSQFTKILRPSVLFIADEIFHSVKHELLKGKYDKLEICIEKNRLVGLIVDHRFRLVNRFDIEAII